MERGKGIPKEREVRGDKSTPRSPTPVNFFYFHKKKGREPRGGNATSFLFMRIKEASQREKSVTMRIKKGGGERKKCEPIFFPN